MRKLALLLIILFASCEAPTTGVSEADSNTFEKNVETLKNNFIKGYEEGDYDKVVSVFADSIRWYGPGVNAEMLQGIDILKKMFLFGWVILKIFLSQKVVVFLVLILVSGVEIPILFLMQCLDQIM
jgi:hypothetical protein